jgi:hypothetical protein
MEQRVADDPITRTNIRASFHLICTTLTFVTLICPRH